METEQAQIVQSAKKKRGIQILQIQCPRKRRCYRECRDIGNEKQNGRTQWAIIGVAISAAVIAIVAGVIVYIIRKKKKSE